MTFKPVLSLACLLMMFFPGHANIQFLEVSPKQAFEQASQDDRLVFAYFHSQDLPVCTILEEKTFQDKRVIAAFDSSFIAVRIDVESNLFSQWEELFDIKCVPTSLMINEEGQLIEIIEGACSAAGLVHKINRATAKNNFYKEYKPIKNHLTSDVDVLFAYDLMTEVFGATLEDTLLSANENLNDNFYTNFFYLASDELPEIEEAPEYQLQPEQLTFDILKPKGKNAGSEIYEIQVGLFKDYQNALQLKASLKKQLGEEPELVEVLIKDKHFYRVLMGTHLSKSSAIQQVKFLNSKGIDSFIRLQ